jgi:hypothetical protein
MPSNPLPAFVDCPSGQTLPGPIAFEGVTMWSFPLEANFATLTELCDKLIARPSGGRVRFAPLSTSVLMNFTVFPRAKFVGHENRGLATERELSFAIPGIYSRFVGPVPVEIGFALFMPLMFLDNPVAMMTGRENYGFFKQAGWIGLPDDSDSEMLSADVYGCPHFSTTAHWGRQRLIRLEKTEPAPPPAAGLRLPWTDVRDAAQQVVQVMVANAVGATVSIDAPLFGPLLSGQVPQLFLKQFRDIADGTRACYQAVTLAHYTVTRIEESELADRYSIAIEALDSTAVVAALGLDSLTQTDIGLKVTMDMQLENGRVLWQA